MVRALSIGLAVVVAVGCAKTESEKNDQSPAKPSSSERLSADAMASEKLSRPENLCSELLAVVTDGCSFPSCTRCDVTCEPLEGFVLDEVRNCTKTTFLGCGKGPGTVGTRPQCMRRLADGLMVLASEAVMYFTRTGWVPCTSEEFNGWNFNTCPD
jgi:hypothetical protein